MRDREARMARANCAATRLPLERETFRSLAEEGQHPHTMVIACCDSRAVPEDPLWDAGTERAQAGVEEVTACSGECGQVWGR